MTDAHLIMDLASKAAEDAMEAVVRTAKLAATSGDSVAVVTMAMCLIEGKARSVRAAMPLSTELEAIVAKVATHEIGVFNAIVAATRQNRGGAR